MNQSLEDDESAEGKVKVLSPNRSWLALGKCASVVISLGRESKKIGDVVAAGLYHIMTKVGFIKILLQFYSAKSSKR